MNKKRRLFVVLLSVVITTYINTVVAFANNGAWISEDNLSSGGSVTNPSSPSSKCKKDNIDCIGYSWIFYRSTGLTTGAIDFVPYAKNKGVPSAHIKESCSMHTTQNGGFWHLGRNAVGYQARGIDYPYFIENGGSLGFGYFGNGGWIKYLTTKGKWGHYETYQYGMVPSSNNHWASDSSKYYQINKGELDHRIYLNGTQIYYAEKYGEIKDVLNDFKKAYKAKYPNTPQSTIDNMDPSALNGTYAFCYWDNMDVPPVDSFEGRTEIYGAATDSVGYIDKKLSKAVNINNCDSVNGCKVIFYHYMNRTSQGDKAGTYQIEQWSNWPYSNANKAGIAIRGTDNPLKKSTFTHSDPTDVYRGEATMYPGMTMCQMLRFTPKSDAGLDSYTKICVHALGNAQPTDDKGNNTLLNIKVKNNNVEKYNSYQNSVYAKPEDTLTYRANYNPILQYTYFLYPQKIRLNGGASLIILQTIYNLVPHCQHILIEPGRMALI